MQQKICFMCHKPITDESKMMKVHQGYCHNECFNAYIGSMTKEKREAQEAKKPSGRKSKKKVDDDVITAPTLTKEKTEEEYRIQKALSDYLCTVSGEQKPRVEWLALAKHYAETYKFSYSDMKLALQYWFEIQGNTYIEGKNPVAIVPYVINEAKAYYAQLEQVKQKNATFDFTKAKERKEIHIEKPKGKSITLVDIGSLGT